MQTRYLNVSDYFSQRSNIKIIIFYSKLFPFYAGNDEVKIGNKWELIIPASRCIGWLESISKESATFTVAKLQIRMTCSVSTEFTQYVMPRQRSFQLTQKVNSQLLFFSTITWGQIHTWQFWLLQISVG